MLAKEPPSNNTLVLTNGCNVPRADIRYMHFWHHAMLAELASRPGTFKLSWARRWLSGYVAKSEKAVLQDTDSTGFWWAVSRSIGEKIAADGGRGHFRILPNAYDSHRFCPGVRREFRQSMRNYYGFSEAEIVFVFSSFGHFERKGLRQGIEAVALLRTRGHKVRLLVLGGETASNRAFIKGLESRGVACDFCVFPGRVDQIENHLSAGDAFLFPSHFEAFSLAEIEAGALGLRLYLTPHYGSEMILRPPVNGEFLPWDSVGMAEVLERDLILGQIGTSHRETGEALSAEEFNSKIRGLFEEAITMKASKPPAVGGY